MKDYQAIRVHMHDNMHRIETIKEFMENNKDADERECKKNIFVLEESNRALSEIQQYRSIGTVEECRAAVEKQKEKKPIQDGGKFINYYKCPQCNEYVHFKDKFCMTCGQKLDFT